MEKTYILPDSLKNDLRRVWGIGIIGGKKEVGKKFKDILKRDRFGLLITVGDYCSLALPSDIKIFDGKVQRKKIKEPLSYSLSFKNPPGTIQKGAFRIIKEAIKEKKNVFVEGEEDLLVIPAVLSAGRGDLVVYGLPKKGICLIEVSEGVKERFRKLLSRFRTP